MKSLWRRAAVMVGGAAILAGSVGCVTTDSYRDLVDPCWPSRYSNTADREVNGFMAPEVLNGQVLDQTIWTYFFETGTDKLNPGGLEQLSYIARRRPAADPHVYLQAATVAEVGGYDPAKAEQLVTARNELDAKRVAAIQKFLQADTVGRGIDFRIDIHDPADPSISSIGPNNAVKDMNQGFKGRLQGGAGASTQGGAGASAGSGSSTGSGTPH